MSRHPSPLPHHRAARPGPGPGIGPAQHSALLLLRGYAACDARAVGAALDTLDESALDETYTYVCAVMDVTLRLTLTAQPSARDVVRAAEHTATAAPPHYEFAFGQAVQAWAAGDLTALSHAADADPPGAVHLLAVMVVALGTAVLDHDGLNALLNCLPGAPSRS
ncbi:hypothetical protein AB0D57_13685 [Streptomyces sp. NPDC048275]|uniref:hypothetical protein n=1 Tax=Streptomyces sp. NPDC048275 TaxID=3155629 RepID=UPI0033D534C6